MTRIKVRLLIGILCGVGVIAPPAYGDHTTLEKVGSYDVQWPSDSSLRSLAPGDTVRVKIAPEKGARSRSAVVSLTRVTRSGVPHVIAKRSLRRGTFAARTQRAGTHRLSVKIGKDFSRVTFDVIDRGATGPCSDPGDVEAEVEVSADEARPRDVLAVITTNTGTACAVGVDFGLKWQIMSNGLWIDVALGVAYPAVIVNLQPGERQTQTITLPQNSTPGRYRVVKSLTNGDEIDVEVTVTP